MPSGALSPSGKRDARIDVKVFEAEKACMRQAAEAVGMTLTDYIVWSCLYGDQCVYAIDPAQLASVRTELARQGNNLNQIAHVANVLKMRRAGNRPVEDMLDDILGLLLRLNEEQHAAYKAVQRLQSSVYRSSLKRLLESEG